MKDSTILVTGALGFVGSNLCSLLAKTTACKMIVGADRGEIAADEAAGPVKNIKIDLLDRKSVSDLLDGLRPGYVFHLAGALSAKDWISHYNGNVEPTINILDAIRHLGLKTRVVIAGSAAEYGRISKEDLPVMESQPLNPVSPYGVAKVWQTTVARYFASNGVDAVIGRIFNIIGKGAPSGLSIGSFASQIGMIKKRQMAPEIRVGNLAPRRDFIDVKDACAGLVALAQRGRTGMVYNICSGQSVSMQDVLRMMIERSRLDIEVSVDPSRFKDADMDDIYGSNKKIREETGWEPTTPLSASIDGIVGGL